MLVLELFVKFEALGLDTVLRLDISDLISIWCESIKVLIFLRKNFL